MAKANVLYKKIIRDIEERILDGEYGEGEMIPTEAELAKLFAVSRVTVRKATDTLVNQGVLIRTPGLGTIIKPNSVIKKTIDYHSFKEEMEILHKEYRTVVVNFTVTEANRMIAGKLQIAEHAMVYYFERCRYGDNEALQYEKTYMSVQKYPDLTLTRLEDSLFAYIEDFKKQQVDVSIHEIIPCPASQELADIFKIEIGKPILKILNTTYLTTGEVMNYTEQYENSPFYQVRYIRTR
ncbi:MAG: GntR family transcriptional regulator [Erysipelotrichaceae bacterium]|nr:GntR family transcriptional regulator [Erysipelotrichaceae bacterium]